MVNRFIQHSDFVCKATRASIGGGVLSCDAWREEAVVREVRDEVCRERDDER